MSNLIDEIRAAREALRRLESETSEAGYKLRMCKEREKIGRRELDTLLDELETGQSRYPLPGFDRLEVPSGNGAPDDHQGPADTTRPARKRRPKPCPPSSDPDPSRQAACDP